MTSTFQFLRFYKHRIQFFNRFPISNITKNNNVDRFGCQIVTMWLILFFSSLFFNAISKWHVCINARLSMHNYTMNKWICNVAFVTKIELCHFLFYSTLNIERVVWINVVRIRSLCFQNTNSYTIKRNEPGKLKGNTTNNRSKTKRKLLRSCDINDNVKHRKATID